MSELESIEKLVEKYKPRIENIFEKEIGDVKVEKFPPHFPQLEEICKEIRLGKLIQKVMIKLIETKIALENPYVMLVDPNNKDTIYVDLKLLKKAKQIYLEVEKKNTVHELTHILDFRNNLSASIKNSKIQNYIEEGFAEYVAHEFPEVYQNERVIERIKEDYKKRTERFKKAKPKMKELTDPYIKGCEFFKKVGDKIGKRNVLKVFENPPQKMEEILQPELYLQRIEGGENGV